MKLKKIFYVLMMVLIVISSVGSVFAVSEEITTDDLQQMRSGVVSIIGISEENLWSGTGFCVSEEPDGTLIFVTNAHVVVDEEGQEAEALFIPLDNDFVTKDGLDTDKIVVLDVLYYNKQQNPDLAVLQTRNPISNVYKFSLADVDRDFSGEKVYAMGYPGVVQHVDTLIEAKDVVITDGMISTNLETIMYEGTDVYLHNALIYSGNSGGPLILNNGAVIGVNTSTYSEDERYVMAMSVSEVVEILEELDVDFTIYGQEEDVDVTAIIIIIAAVIALVVAAVVIIFVIKNKKNSKPLIEEQISYTEPVKDFAAPIEEIRVKRIAVKGVGGYMDGRTYELSDSVTQIGRSSECIIRYPEGIEGISKVHCKLIKKDNSLFVEDKSTYGTYLKSGEKLIEGKQYELNDGDMIFLANEKNAFMVIKK